MRSFDLIARPLLMLPLAAMVFVQYSVAQQPAPAAAVPPPAAAPNAASGQAVSQQDLDQLLAPIALYPDALIAQILMASTYPLEVVEAARWSAANPGVKDKALEDAMQKQTWDESVKALTSVPQVLKQMSDNLSWTQKLGDAFLADQKTVLATVQTLRGKAQAAGNLKTTPEQTVTTEVVENKTVYVIESAKPEVVYVPTYNPSTIYGPWWYPVPPYYMYPPAYVYPPGLAFATGVVVGAAIWGNCNWHGGGSVNINVNRYNSFNRTNISNTNFNHNVEHRKGVAYQNQNVAQKYNRGGNAQAAQSREQFRGRAEQGRAEMGAMDRNELNRSVQQGDRGAAANRGADRAGAGGASPANASRDIGGAGRAGASPGNANRDAGGAARAGAPSPSPARRDAAASSRGSGGSGFSGAGNGGAARGASSRGGASRGSMGGGGGARGGGGRR